ncbi:TniQ family protein [Paenibacillus qinlingensis]|uniref:TniQ family protein n=1 Tax=Paenibacillus qinlingensis TaxID=1837343 RepID=UPI001563D9ED|nr:TniQ family protein [Paenibacillus qinlingensis]NQX62212.1 TniQ family protein [Paenibacillus qinlingensis]
MNESFTIIPREIEHESLSGYLDKVFTKNKFSFESLKKIEGLFLNNKVNHIKQHHRLDYYPETVINLQLLARLLGSDIQNIKKKTFSYLLDSFSKVSGTNNPFGKSVMHQLITTTRRFCTVCLSEGVTHKLMWQVKEIKICNIHKIPLVNTCNKCGKQQTYQNRWGLHRRYCNYCTFDLSKNIVFQVVVEDQDLISEQLNRYEDWSVLLDPKLSEYNLFRGNKQNYIAALYYVSQGMPEVYNKSLGNLERREETLFNCSLFNKERAPENIVTLERTFKYTRTKKVGLKEFFDLIIPSEYIRLLLLDKHANNITPRKCFSPWCNYYQDSSGLKTVHLSRKKLKTLLYFCRGCQLTYRYDSNKNWIEEKGYIQTGYEQVLPLVNKGYSVYKISRILSIPTSFIQRSTGYFANHDMLKGEAKNKFTPLHLQNNVLDKFKHIDNIRGSMFLEARRLYGWSSADYYFYLANHEVQEYFISNDVTQSAARQQMEPKVIKAVQDLYQNKVLITHQKVADILGITPSLLGIYKFQEYISDFQKIQIQQKIENFYEEAEIYIDSVKEEPTFSKGAIYKITGCDRKWTEKYIVDFENWYNTKKNEHMSQYLVFKEEQLKIKISNIVKENKLIGQKLTVREFAAKLGTNNTSLWRMKINNTKIQELFHN